MGLDEVRAIVEGETGRQWMDIFQSMDEQPLGSASIGQVREGRGEEGERASDELVQVSFIHLYTYLFCLSLALSLCLCVCVWMCMRACLRALFCADNTDS